MNKILVGLVLIAVLMGLGGGYILGYAIYQPRLQSLQDDLGNLKDDFTATNRDMGKDIATLQSQVTNWIAETDRMHSNLLGLQDQLALSLSSVNTTLTNLNGTVNQIENRSWHEVWSASSPTITSGYFQLKGKMFQIRWACVAQFADSMIEVTLRFSNGTQYWSTASSGRYGAFASEGPNEQTQYYYVGIETYGYTDWAVSIYDFY